MTENPIAQRIEALIEASDLKDKAELFRVIGIPYSRGYELWRRIGARPRDGDALEIADYFGVPVGHILNGDPIPDMNDKKKAIAVFDDLPVARQKEALGYLQFLLEQEKQDKGSSA